jgi:hypothetical protein
MKLTRKRPAIWIALRRQQGFFKLARKFRKTEDPKEVRRLGEKLGKKVFGELRPRMSPAPEGGRYKRGRRKIALTVFT